MSRKPLIFLSVFNVFEKVGSVFFEKPVFHFKPSEASFSGVMCLASRLLENPKWLLENPKGPLAPGGPAGPLGTGVQRQDSQNPSKLSEACQDPPGASRTHPGSTRDAPGAPRTTFYFISQQNQAPTPRARPGPGALIELQSPSDRITHTGAIEISWFGLTPQPPMFVALMRSRVSCSLLDDQHPKHD